MNAVLSVSALGASAATSGSKKASESKDSNASVFTSKGVSSEKAQKTRSAILNDINEKKLTYNNGELFGVKLFKPTYSLHSERMDKDLTFGEIKKRYNLEPGVLKECNNLRIPAGYMTHGSNLDDYTPAELGYETIKIPADALHKYIK